MKGKMAVFAVVLTMPFVLLHINSYFLDNEQGGAATESSSVFDSIPTDLIGVGIGVIGTLLGVIISILGNWLAGYNLAKRQAFV